MNHDEFSAPDPDDQANENKPGAKAWLEVGALIAWQVGKALLSWLNASARSRQEVREEVAETETREKDRNLTLEAEKHLVSRRRWGTFLIACSFVASFAGGVGFLVAYWTDGSTQMLGGFLALFMAGWGAGSVFWAHWLTAHKEAVEPREAMTPPPEEREAARKDFCSGKYDMQRRGLLKWMCACGLALVGGIFISLVRSLGFSPGNALYTDVWKRGQRLMTADGQPMRVDSLPPGSTAIVFPEDSIGSENSQTVLIRVDQQLMQLPSDRADWAPMGNLAFSRVCTHAGCAVGMYERTVHLLMCPCHQSTFDVLKAAQPTSGPAARPLPQLPLYVDAEGILRAGGGFSGLPGPGFWGMPS